MILEGDALRALAKEASLAPQEETLEIGKKNKQLFIGIPKEEANDNRVALVPDDVALLVANGHRVLIETNAGKNANFSDREYSEAGGEIVFDKKEVFKADLILKISPPSKEEIEYMKNKQTLISALQLTTQPKDTLKRMMDKKVTAIAWDYIQDESGLYPIIRSMGEIAGNTSVLIAAECLSNANKGKGLMFGGIAGVSPTEVVILGAGTVGEYATRSALGLGASVKVFDDSISKLRRLQNDLGMRLSTSIIQPKVLLKALKRADVVIGAIRAPHGRTPCVVSENMVEQMKEGSVIVDVSIDQGGCFETSKVTTHEKPTYVKHGVIHYCVPNIASRVSRTASFALSNTFTPIILEIGNNGGLGKILKNNEGFRHGVYIYNGTLTSSYLGETFGLPYKDMNLLRAAF
jgi:alanine dehydrogenase